MKKILGARPEKISVVKGLEHQKVVGCEKDSVRKRVAIFRGHRDKGIDSKCVETSKL